MENLNKSWSFEMVISRAGNVLEKKKNTHKVLEKSWKCVIFICAFMLSFN